MKPPTSRFWPIAVPYPHFMGLAPLDVWFRLLFRPAVAIPPRYWPRLAFALLLSTLVTILSLHERVLTGLWLWLRPRRDKLPGPVIVLGYYRSGTTLLQHLLSCDPNLYAPHWAQALIPQGFCLTWGLLRWFLLPLLPRTRPQDNVTFGPLVPAEDDFALNNWALASPLAGRLIVPGARPFYDRFNGLKDLAPAEYQRWVSHQFAFVSKLACLAGKRRIILKTPAHTARIKALLDLFRDTTGVKFVYISRHPHQVFRSNVAMLDRLGEIWGLQSPPPPQEQEEFVLGEFVATEEEYERTRGLIPAENLAEIRLQDLQADPLGTMRRIYERFSLPFTPAFEQRLIAYLNANRDYKPNVHQPWTAEQKQRIATQLEPLIVKGRHTDPPTPKVELPLPDPAVRPRQIRRAVGVGLLVALLFLGPWWLLTAWVGGDSLGTVWFCGIAIGVGVLRGASNRGSTALGLYAVLLTAGVFLTVLSLSYTLLPEVMQTMPFYLLAGCFWPILGMVSAYRIGSQRF